MAWHDPGSAKRPRDIARDIASALDHARGRARKLPFDRASALGRRLDLLRAVNHARDRASLLARDLTIASDRTRVRDLGRIYDCILASNDGPDLASDLGRASASATAIAGALERARNQVADPGRVEQVVPPSAGSRQRVKARRVAPSARHLAAVAAWLLPAGERARYGEEYRSELHDLAAAGAGHPQQLGYAVRLLGRVAPLRVARLAPRRGMASP